MHQLLTRKKAALRKPLIKSNQKEPLRQHTKRKSTNVCYCCGPKESPLLFDAPTDRNRKPGKANIQQGSSIGYTPKSVFLQRHRGNASGYNTVRVHEKYTPIRAFVEDTYNKLETLEEKLPPRTPLEDRYALTGEETKNPQRKSSAKASKDGKYDKLEENEELSIPYPLDDHLFIRNFLAKDSNRPETPQEHSVTPTDAPSLIEDCSKIQKVQKIRSQNYFETHSLVNVRQASPDHKCVHRFVLNDRLFLEPLNADPYGNSMCVICNELISNARDGQNFHGLNFLSGKEKAEIQLPRNFTVDERVMKRVRKPAPINSWALRYQKGVA